MSDNYEFLKRMRPKPPKIIPLILINNIIIIIMILIMEFLQITVQSYLSQF